jgi:hypothetical protein
VEVVFSLLCLACAAAPAAAEQPSVLERRVGLGPAGEVVRREGRSTEGLVRSVLWLISGIPVGLEEAAAAPDPGSEPGQQPLVLTGLTIRQVLELIARGDSRYRWREMDGVVVLRPIAAWNQKDHFLHAAVGPFVHDNQPAGSVVGALQQLVFPGFRSHAGTEQAWDHVISVSLGSASLLGALNAIARQSGAMWSIGERSCRPTPCIELHDAQGRGSGTVFLPGAFRVRKRH